MYTFQGVANTTWVAGQLLHNRALQVVHDATAYDGRPRTSRRRQLGQGRPRACKPIKTVFQLNNSKRQLLKNACRPSHQHSKPTAPQEQQLVATVFAEHSTCQFPPPTTALQTQGCGLSATVGSERDPMSAEHQASIRKSGTTRGMAHTSTRQGRPSLPALQRGNRLRRLNQTNQHPQQAVLSKVNAIRTHRHLPQSKYT